VPESVNLNGYFTCNEKNFCMIADGDLWGRERSGIEKKFKKEIGKLDEAFCSATGQEVNN